MTLIKSEIISELTEQFKNLPEKSIASGVNMIIDQMSNSLAEGGRIEIRGFGTFCLHYHAPRNAHNPRTGEKVKTTGKYSPHFKPGKQLRLDVDKSKENTSIIDDSAQDDDNE